MDYAKTAEQVLVAIGGAGNVKGITTCLTRLRITLAVPSAANFDEVRAIRGVLGVTGNEAGRLDVVFGPTTIEGISREFAEASGIGLDGREGRKLDTLPMEGFETAKETGPVRRISIPAGRRRSYRAQQQAALENERLGKDDLNALREFLDDGKDPEPASAILVGGSADAPHSLLVINGPNINMLGLREPAIYGREDYATLVRICKTAANEAGFANVKCFQSNHEGAIVDEIQAALHTYDGIVINPAAYTHTSVAILDAVKAVSLPCIEVHISKVESREDFRQVSYVRQACFETITGLGLAGYRKAIFDMAAHLGMPKR